MYRMYCVLYDFFTTLSCITDKQNVGCCYKCCLVISLQGDGAAKPRRAATPQAIPEYVLLKSFSIV